LRLSLTAAALTRVSITTYRKVMTQLVDWDVAVAAAGALGKSGPRVSYDQAAEVVAQLRELAGTADRHVSEYTGLPSKPSPVLVCDRRDWAAANVTGLREVVAPLEETLVGKVSSTPASLRAVGAKATGAQTGAVLAYMSGKVLGQYEVFAPAGGQLLLVAPNIVGAERALVADPHDFRLWVCLHEVTHRVQFTAVPWLRGYFLDQVHTFLRAADLEAEAVAERARRVVQTVARAARGDDRVSLLDLVQTPAQREVMERLTALMTLVEGHAEHVMDGVGPEVVPSVASIRAAFDARRATANPIERLIRRLLGVDTKLRQYAEGKSFVNDVVDRVGMTDFNRIWESPDTLPRVPELTRPDLWVERVHGRVGA
jgi:coenzyme F420 biosynthesis associated uncharacterized protein